MTELSRPHAEQTQQRHPPKAAAFDRVDSGPTTGAPSRQIIVLRGDLFSHTGYAKATRALERSFARLGYRRFAVSLFEHPSRRTETIDCPVVTDEDVASQPMFHDAVVINVCLPDHFRRFPNAFNVGYFFWETDTLPIHLFWQAHMALMDALWAPSRWQKSLVKTWTGRSEVAIVPWPQEQRDALPPSATEGARRCRAQPPMTETELDSYLARVSAEGVHALRRHAEELSHAAGLSNRFDPDRAPSLASLLEKEGKSFIAVQTDAPRKGLPSLVSAWMQFREKPEGRDARLFVKLSSIDVTADMFRIHFHASLAVVRAKRRFGIADPGIWFIYDRLDDDEMRALLASADAYVTATMGEGFGGPIAEALLEGIPVVAPDHTACRDIVGDDYELAVPSERHVLKLWNNIPVYSPSSSWYLIDDRAMADRFASVAAMDAKRRRKIASDGRAALLSHTGTAFVDARLGQELLRIKAHGLR